MHAQPLVQRHQPQGSHHEHHHHRPTDRHLERRPDALARRLPRQAPRHLHRARRVPRLRGPARDRRRRHASTASGTVKVASIDTADGDRDGHLKSADFFDVETYPEITFESTSITATDDDTYEITGDLTLHGVTKPITLQAEVGGSEVDPFGNTRVGLEATGEISRSDYGMKFNMALGSGNLAVSDKVKLDLDISAVKQADERSSPAARRASHSDSVVCPRQPRA